MISLAALAVFSGLSLNLLLQFALGASGTAGDAPGKGRREIPFFQFCVLFISVVFLWLFFSYFFPPRMRGFSEYFLLFPFSALACTGFELLFERVLPRILKRRFPKVFAIIGPQIESQKKIFSGFTAYEGLAFASLFITLNLAAGFGAVLVLALFFVLGNMAAMFTLNEIRRRSTLEWVPRYLRGSPLIFISMGLLSLVSASAAGICLKVLEVLP